jgi:large-conductance mechanosensitive channel
LGFVSEEVLTMRFVPVAVFMAIKEAVKASRKDAGEAGWVKLDAPATPEQLRQLLPTVKDLLHL